MTPEGAAEARPHGSWLASGRRGSRTTEDQPARAGTGAELDAGGCTTPALTWAIRVVDQQAPGAAPLRQSAPDCASFRRRVVGRPARTHQAGPARTGDAGRRSVTAAADRLGD